MKSESRLKKVFTDLSMSNEEKVLKKNYGQNFEVHLSQFPSPSRSLEASASGKVSRPGTLHNQARAGARSVAARNLSANQPQGQSRNAYVMNANANKLAAGRNIYNSSANIR